MTKRSLADSIKPLKARREAKRPVRTKPGRCLPALFVRERIESRVVPYLQTLREAIPHLGPRRRLYDGAWVLGLSAKTPDGMFKGRVYEAYSRIEFTIRLNAVRGEYSVACRTTVFGHDLHTEYATGRFDASTRDVGEFVERQCLKFARGFLDAAPRSLRRELEASSDN